MALPGQLKTKIDQLKKRIEDKGSSLQPERQRLFRKRLKRLQRARRTALVIEQKAAARAKGKGAAKGAAEGAAGEGEAVAPA
jgi:hypothetical protein